MEVILSGIIEISKKNIYNFGDFFSIMLIFGLDYGWGFELTITRLSLNGFGFPFAHETNVYCDSFKKYWFWIGFLKNSAILSKYPVDRLVYFLCIFNFNCYSRNDGPNCFHWSTVEYSPLFDIKFISAFKNNSTLGFKPKFLTSSYYSEDKQCKMWHTVLGQSCLYNI